MAKFQNKNYSSTSQSVPVSPAPQADAAVTAEEPALIAQNNHAIAEGMGDVMAETESTKDIDRPNTKYADHDFSKSDMFLNGKRMVQTDALARALNAEEYLLDVPKPWGHNPLGGRPIPVYYTREFPSKQILYDHIDSSPETSTKEKVEKIVSFKRKLANDHGYMYLYQHQWATLTSAELDRQLAHQKAYFKKEVAKK